MQQKSQTFCTGAGWRLYKSCSRRTQCDIDRTCLLHQSKYGFSNASGRGTGPYLELLRVAFEVAVQGLDVGLSDCRCRSHGRVRESVNLRHLRSRRGKITTLFIDARSSVQVCSKLWNTIDTSIMKLEDAQPSAIGGRLTQVLEISRAKTANTWKRIVCQQRQKGPGVEINNEASQRLILTE